MANQVQKNFNNGSDPQQMLAMDPSTRRDLAQLTSSEKQLVELRKQILNSQNSTYGHHGGQLNFNMQGTTSTDELLQNFERDQNGSLGAFAVGLGGNNTLQIAQNGITSGSIAGAKVSNLQQTVKIIDLTR